MERTLGEYSAAQIQEVIEAMSTDQKLRLLTNMMGSESTMMKLKEIILEYENEDLQEIKYFLQANRLGVDPNPWDNLPAPGHHLVQRSALKNTHTGSAGSTRLGRPKNLGSLPNEILHKIANQLPLNSAVALALVNRDFKERLGPVYIGPVYLGDTVNFNSRIRFEFLQLLERDSPMSIACPSCQKLHHWKRHGCDERVHAHTPRLPTRTPTFFSYNRVRAAALSYIKYGDDSPECMVTPRRSMSENSIRATRSTVTRFIEGNLISRSQIAVAPCLRDDKFTGNSFSTLIKIITTPAFQICDHYDWPWFLQYLDGLDSDGDYGRDDSQPTGERFSTAHTWDDGNREDQYEFYNITDDKLNVKGLGDLAIQAYHHPTILCPSLHQMFFWGFPGQVRSCNCCATDFGLAVKHVEGVGPVLVMSVWRDLGGPCQEGEDSLRSSKNWRWDSHRYDVRQSEMADLNPAIQGYIRDMAGLRTAGNSSRGRIALNFEGPAGSSQDLDNDLEHLRAGCRPSAKIKFFQ